MATNRARAGWAQYAAVPAVVLAALASYAVSRAVLSAAAIELLDAPANLPVLLAARPGRALEPLAGLIASAAARQFGPTPLAVGVPALAISLALVSGVFVVTSRRVSHVAATWSALALLATGRFSAFTSPHLPMLPGTLLVLALANGEAIAGERHALRSGTFILLACAAVYLDAGAAFAAIALCLVLVATSDQRRRVAPAVTMVALFAAAVGGYALLSGDVGLSVLGLLRTPQTAVRQPFYALAFLQNAYGQALGLLVPATLGLFALAALAPDRELSEGHDRRGFLAPAALALLPVWAFAPAWIVAGTRAPVDPVLVAAGCCILIGVAAARLGATAQRSVAVSGTVALILLAAAAALMRDPAVTLRRDLTEHRSRFALVGWANLLDRDLPVLVANHDVYVQLRHYAPEAIGRRLAYVDATTPAAAQFTSTHHAFYVFEGAEVRSPLLGWLADRGVVLSEPRVFFPRDLSLDAPAYLYRVEVD